MATYVLIFNQFTLEFLLFPESAVMCLSVFCVILASIQTVENKKYKYLKITIYLFITILSYQSTIVVFPVISLLLNFINKQENKNKLKEIFKYALIIILVIAVEYGIIMFMNHILGESMTRMVKLINMEAFFLRLKYAIYNVGFLIIGFMNMLPHGFNILVIILTIIGMIINKNLRKYTKNYLMLLFLIISESILIMFLFDSGQCARTNWNLGMIWGISLIFLLQDIDKEKRINQIITIFVIISFLFNSIMLLQNSSQHIAANKVDENMGYSIRYKVKKYEAETGNKITRFAYIQDFDPSQYAKGIKKMGSLTERALACDWSVHEAMNYYLDRKLEEEIFPYSIYFEKASKINYSEYSDDQIILENDTLYLIIY